MYAKNYNLKFKFNGVEFYHTEPFDSKKSIIQATNFRNEMSRVFAPQKAEISAAAANFHKKYQEYKKKQF